MIVFQTKVQKQNNLVIDRMVDNFHLVNIYNNHTLELH